MIKNKSGQVTIFIILALIIVVIILLLFFLIKGPSVDVLDEKNPQTYIDGCSQEAIEEAVEILLKNGGDLEPEGSLMYEGKELVYLCYNENYYEPCINQRPMLIEHFEKEITKYIQPRISNCFQSLKSELDGEYDVVMGEMQVTTKLRARQIKVNIKRDFKMSRGENVQSFTEFKSSLIHPLYNLGKTAMEIVNQESHYCNFENLGFMLIYPEYDINKFRTGDSDTIYTIKDLVTNKEFKFAIRSCAMPAGF